MAAYLRLIAHAAQRHAHELAVGGARDALTQRGLAHARRAHQAQDGAAQILHALLYGQVFDDALLDLLQPVMVALEHLLGRRDVQMTLLRFFHGALTSQSM